MISRFNQVKEWWEREKYSRKRGSHEQKYGDETQRDECGEQRFQWKFLISGIKTLEHFSQEL